MQGYWLFFVISSLLGIALVYTKSILVIIFFAFYLGYVRLYKGIAWKRTILILFCFGIYLVNMSVHTALNHTKLDERETHFLLQITDEVKIDGAVLSSFGRSITGEKLLVTYRIQSEQEKLDLEKKLRVGETCKINGKLQKIKAATNENAFDYAKYLANKHVFWKLKVEAWQSCEPADDLLSRLKRIRHHAVTTMSTILPNELAAFLNASIFGERTLLEPIVTESYQTLGIIHLLAISGFNVALMIVIITYVLARLGVTKESIRWLLLLFLPFMMIMSGCSPSVIRAVWMAMALLLQTMSKNRYLKGIDLASIVFLVYVFIEPFALFDIGFQMSFIVTVSLLLSQRILSRFQLRPVYALFITSLISQICSLPFVLYYYFEFSALSLLVNLIYIPLFSFVILPLLLLLILFVWIFPFAAQPIFSLLNQGLVTFHHWTALLAAIPHQVITLGRPSIGWMLIYGFCFLFTLRDLEINQQRFTFSFIPILLVVQFVMPLYSSSGEITFIDVGQGDSILIRHGWNQQTYLIDTGGTVQFSEEEWEKRSDPFEVGKDTVVPLLKSKGIRTIDKLILTHGDMDHVGGTMNILKEIKVKELIVPKAGIDAPLMADIITDAKQRDIHISYVERGMSWTSLETTFHVLHPEGNDKSDEKNNQSLVLYVKLGGLKWLFTGDLEELGEKQLLTYAPHLKVDVLKVGHHGSNSSTSETFLDSIAPRVAIISVGENNRYGHPHQDVIERLSQKSVKIFRTDEDGSITYLFRGEQGTFSRRKP